MRPELVAGWYQGLTLDAIKAQKLWAAHEWQLIDPPADLVELMQEGLTCIHHQRVEILPQLQSN